MKNSQSDLGVNASVVNHGWYFSDRHVRRERPPSPAPTCVSMKSDRSKDHPIDFQKEDVAEASRQVHETVSCQGYA